MSKPFEQLTIKGDTYARHLQSEKGRGLLRWLTTLEVKDDKFAEWTKKRNAWILEQLDEHPHDVEVNRAMTPEPPRQTDSDQIIISKLDEILSILKKEEVQGTNTDTYEQPQWDETDG